MLRMDPEYRTKVNTKDIYVSIYCTVSMSGMYVSYVSYSRPGIARL